MEIAPKYEPRAVEDKWYSFWLERNLFHSEPDITRKPFTVVIPPPNVTGVLHMGHMLNNTIQDVLVRRARMMGYNACWVPGTDHASIATEAKVVNMLKEKGINKREIGRDEFMKHAWQWKEEHGDIILRQLRKLGCSCDWERTAFTMDETRYESVIKVFVDLYYKGLIYRGVRMVNWDPVALTAVSDEEVVYKESNSKLFFLRYYVAEVPEKYVVVATTRPETILGDTAVCVHPDDERYQWLKGKHVLVPLVGREVPVIMDGYVDREFGTGALKITPAHDVNDYNLGIKYGLQSINIFNDNGTLNDNGGAYKGMDRFVCRKQIIKDLADNGLVEKTEDYKNKVGHSERTDAVIEPKLSAQWFLKMENLAPKALEVVENDEIQFHPAKFKNIYRHWLENIKDWCISRQLWWGQRIPAYYYQADGKQQVVVAESIEEAFVLAEKEHPGVRREDLQQDEDVLDTWFSSWLWPISLFDGIRKPDNPEINYYYPTDNLITAPDIIFFWVARMIMCGEEYRHEVPFRHVYFTGIVRDKLGRKMSKSLGNSPDPIMLIEKYGADGVRMGMLLTAPAGNDLPFDESICEQGRNFANKMWNALRLVTGWQRSDTLKQNDDNHAAVEWMEQRMANVLEEVEQDFNDFRLSEALMKTYKLTWDDFCSWYLEMVKPAFGEPIDNETHNSTISIFERLMCMLHPFMPFITEEIWHLLAERCNNASIMTGSMPASVFYDKRTLDAFATVQEMVTGVRGLRNGKGIPPKEALELYVFPHAEGSQVLDGRFDGIVKKLANLSKIEVTDHKVVDSLAFMVGTIECFVPFGQNIDAEAELKKLESDLKYAEGFLTTVMKKLSNDKFVNGAPEKVVNLERQKKADAEQKIAAIKEQIAALKR
ncbi:MAG: valine--tRNA ligase [Bacteroidales bacterium]|nr:valine--tRNA ligase [Bacteroidales bacterium]